MNADLIRNLKRKLEHAEIMARDAQTKVAEKNAMKRVKGLRAEIKRLEEEQ